MSQLVNIQSIMSFTYLFVEDNLISLPAMETRNIQSGACINSFQYVIEIVGRRKPIKKYQLFDGGS